MARVPTESVRFVKELYPRLKPSDDTIARYVDALDLLPPITTARGGVLVDGYHRWMAHQRAGVDTIDADDLGDLTDVEIIKESVRRNATHGHQLVAKDKRRLADQLYRQGVDADEIRLLLSITEDTIETYLRDARRDEKAEQQAKAWDLWLDCHSERAIADAVGVTQKTINNWVSNSRMDPEFTQPPDPHMAFDYWMYGPYDGDSTYFGKLQHNIVENLLWLFTDVGQIVVDPFAGSGTTVKVGKTMGRRVWASDRRGNNWDRTLPIHSHDITIGWPDDAPRRADLVLLDPPYWQQAAGRYSDDPADLANQPLETFMQSWAAVVKTCADRLADGGRLAYIISPTQIEEGGVVDHATDMLDACREAGLRVERRIIVPYNTQQATGQQVTWARENKRLLKLYRDLVVMAR